MGAEFMCKVIYWLTFIALSRDRIIDVHCDS